MTDPDVTLMQQLHDDHADALWRFCRRLVPNDRQLAEDVVQETLLRAWRHRTILESPTPAVRAWLFTVARNIVIDQWRSRRVHPETPLAEPPDEGVDDETDQAARRLGIPEGTVKSRTHYALRALKLSLDELGVGT